MCSHSSGLAPGGGNSPKGRDPDLNKTEGIPSGIKGLDGLLEGGLVRGSITLLLGPPGTGKSFICHQFIHHGLKRGEPCLYVSTLLDSTRVKEQVRRAFGWDYGRYEERGLLRIVDLHSRWAEEYFPEIAIPPLEYRAMPLNVKQVLTVISKAREEVGHGGRGVFYSFSSLFLAAEDVKDILKLAHAMKARCRQIGTTAIYVIDKGAQSDQIEEYMKALADCVVETDILGEELRLRIVKAPMKHDRGWHPFEITSKGVGLIK